MGKNVLIKGYDAMEGCVEDVNSYRPEICGNIVTFSVYTRIHKLYGFSPPTIEHVWDKTKPDANISKVVRSAIADIQRHTTLNTFLVRGHSDKRGPPY
jgi:hypothetical protein